MNIDISILYLFVGMSFGIIGIGYLIRFSIPMSLFIFIAGGLMVSLFIMTDNITVGYNTDKTEEETIYEIDSLTGLYDVCGGAGCTHTIRGEYVANSASDLHLTEFDKVTYHLRKSGSPTGNIEFGVYDGTSNTANPILLSFGIFDSSLLSGVATNPITFILDEPYTLQSGNVVGFRYTGGSSGNAVRTQAGDNEPFDSTNTIHRALAITTNVWGNVANSDIQLELFLGSNTVFTNEPINHEFTEELKTFMVLMSAILMMVGGLVEIDARRR